MENSNEVNDPKIGQVYFEFEENEMKLSEIDNLSFEFLHSFLPFIMKNVNYYKILKVYDTIKNEIMY